MLVGQYPVEMKIDSGSNANTIAANIWDEMLEAVKRGEVTLYNLRSQSNNQLLAYGNYKLTTIAQFEARLSIIGHEENPQRKPRVETFTVVANSSSSLMSRATAESLNLLKVGFLEVNQVEKVKTFPCVPNYIVSFDIDESVPGHVDMALRVPLAYREEQKKVLDNYAATGIVEKVPPSSSPKFVSAQFFVPKANGTKRLVNDNKEANKAIRRMRHSMPTLEDFLPSMVGCKFFSVIDVKDAFLHLPLDEKSKSITTFNSPWGLYRYTRLPFGITAAPEIFQAYMDSHFKPLPGTHVFMDDIIVGGSSVKECKERTDNAMEVARQLNLTLATDKMKLCVESVNFLGMTLDKNGVHPTYEKLETLRKMKPPINIKQLRGYLGLLNFFASFIPNTAELTKQMRKLLKSNTPFVWTEEMQNEFDKTRTMLSSSATRAFFDEKAETLIYTDASNTALGAIMTQIGEDGKEKMVMCASRSVSPTESNYGQSGLEALAIVWAMEKWCFFTLGREIIVITDATALAYIYNNATRQKREENRARAFALKLSPFNFKVKTIPGKENPADPLSRMIDPPVDEWTEATEIFHVQVTVPDWKFTVSFEDIKDKTRECPELREVLKALDTGKWPAHLIKYKIFESEMMNCGGVLTRGTKIIPPVGMRDEILKDGHELHPGIVTMKRFIRLRAWWPGLDKDIEDLVKSCYACILNSRPNAPIPQRVHESPRMPWDIIAIDLHSHKPDKSPENQSPYDKACRNDGGNKRSLLVIVDLYSRFTRIWPMPGKTDTDAVMKLLKLTFAFYGRPNAVKMDNGPPFNGKEFLEYFAQNSIDVIHSTPLWPQHNSNVERLMSTINNRLRKGNIEEKEFNTLIVDCNRRINEWPHSATGMPPFDLFFRRDAKLALPSLEDKEQADLELLDREREIKINRKYKTDSKRRAKESPIKEGDFVVILREDSDKSKIHTTYKDEIWVVKTRDNSELCLQNVNNPMNFKIRNINRCKLVPAESLPVQVQKRLDAEENPDPTSPDNSDISIGDSISVTDEYEPNPQPKSRYGLRDRNAINQPLRFELVELDESTGTIGEI